MFPLTNERYSTLFTSRKHASCRRNNGAACLLGLDVGGSKCVPCIALHCTPHERAPPPHSSLALSPLSLTLNQPTGPPKKPTQGGPGPFGPHAGLCGAPGARRPLQQPLVLLLKRRRRTLPAAGGAAAGGAREGAPRAGPGACILQPCMTFGRSPICQL